MTVVVAWATSLLHLVLVKLCAFLPLHLMQIDLMLRSEPVDEAWISRYHRLHLLLASDPCRGQVMGDLLAAVLVLERLVRRVESLIVREGQVVVGARYPLLLKRISRPSIARLAHCVLHERSRHIDLRQCLSINSLAAVLAPLSTRLSLHSSLSFDVFTGARRPRVAAHAAAII